MLVTEFTAPALCTDALVKFVADVPVPQGIRPRARGYSVWNAFQPDSYPCRFPIRAEVRDEGARCPGIRGNWRGGLVARGPLGNIPLLIP